MLPVAERSPIASFDPQGHRMGPVGTLACQASVVLGLIWSFGALTSFFLPTSTGVLALAPALGAVFLAPKSVVMQFPVSLSLLAVITIVTASVAWTIDPFATSVVLRGIVPAILGVILAAGLLPLRDLGDALVWAVRLTVVITILALVAYPETRTHLSTGDFVDNYPGWHGFFIHKNKMSPFLVFGVATVLTFDRSGLFKWGTLGVLGVLLIGSTSATGISAAVLIVVAWVWLRIYQGQDDLRTSTVFFSVSALGFLVLVAGSIMSLATITGAYGKELTFSGRTFIWQASIEAIQRRPLFGHGLGALFWVEGISPETAEIWRQVGFRNSHAHNGALDLALQIGLVGLAIFAVVWLTTFGRAWRALRTQPDLSVWVVSVLFAQMFMSISEDVYLGGWIAVLAMMKLLLLRRPESLKAGRIGQMSKWSAA
ncbi:MAG: O-antigen ligase family protein [Acidimicrobiia bacterium]|nr:O-antigen ligase family protein [Acidimicrobiia bacterium]